MPLVRRDPPSPTMASIPSEAGRHEDADGLGIALGTETDPRARAARLAARLTIADPSAAAGSMLPGLLADPEPDIRLLAPEIARTQPTERANALPGGPLDAETHPNVCGAAVGVPAEVGTPAAIPALSAARTRFAPEACLPPAIDTVLARLGQGR